MDSLHVGESSERKDSNLIRNMSLKIDSLRKIVKIKTLDDNTEKKEYVFSTSGKAGIQTNVNHCKTSFKDFKNKPLPWCSKDISIDISKNKKPFNQFKSDLASLKNDFENLSETIEKENRLTIN
uniref:Uncharacterized protein n=1 Tax=Lactuca sativa TaxID=4236 RepID=A0A9R1XXP9_LACSA|nr:hypothetical protein LSAT_V11C100001580 [Lactuca sativa]